MTAREETVLAARDPAIDDENDWQEFGLVDVKVHVPGKSRFANLLTASRDNALRVTGQLEVIEEDQEHLVLDEDYRSKRIVIDNVTHFAYGQHDDGEVGLWVAGLAGWFSITPARSYRPMFNVMAEAIDLLYFLLDKHKKKGRGRRKNWNPKLEYILDEYVIHSSGRCQDAEDAAEALDKHHNFLITQILGDKESVEWESTPLYEHLVEKYPDDFERIRDLLEGSQDGDETEEREDTPDDSTTSEEPTESLTRAQADTIFETILDMKEAGAISKRQMSVKHVAEMLLKRFEMDSVESAKELIRARAGFLVEMMDSAKTETFDWAPKAIYKELRAQAKREAPDVGGSPLHPRSPKPEEFPSLDDMAEEGESTDDEANIPRGRRGRLRKSILRPAGSVSTTVAGKRYHDAMPSDGESEDEDDGPSDVETPSKVNGHKLVRDPLSARVNGGKRLGLSPAPTLSKLAVLQDALSERSKESPTISATEYPAENGDVVPELPPDAWKCPVQGCDTTVYKASTKRSKESIESHSLIHAEETKTQLDLVLAEQQKNINVSVDNLLSRIRSFGAFNPSDPVDEAQNGEPSKRVKI